MLFSKMSFSGKVGDEVIMQAKLNQKMQQKMQQARRLGINCHATFGNVKRAIAAGLMAVAPVSALAEGSVALLFNERPPYLMQAKDGSATGLTGTPAAYAFKAAGIKVVWTQLSTKRQMQALSENAAMSCAIGWFKTKEREQFAKFTKAIYRDHPFVAVAASGFKIENNSNLAQVLENGSTRVLVKEGFSYGDIDMSLKKAKAQIIVNNGEVVELMQIIKARRADFMFAAQEEANYLIKNAGFKDEDFRLIQFSDMPPGKTRHIMCSKKVPDAMIEKLNSVIQME